MANGVFPPKYGAEDVRSGCQTGKEGQEIPLCCNSVDLEFFSLGSQVQHLKAGVTLSYKRLAGVEENLAALYDHALYCQVLPDVFGLAHFIVHDSREKGRFIILI